MCGTYTIDVLAPVLIGLDDDLDGDIRAILLKELAQHLALKHKQHMSTGVVFLKGTVCLPRAGKAGLLC